MEKINRRQFLKLCGRIMTGAILVSLFPFKLFGNDTYLGALDAIAKKFAIPVKPFRRGDLYDKHNLVG